ncbi:MAG: DUF1080 domain-containing protein [Bacteroidales bacterium]
MKTHRIYLILIIMALGGGLFFVWYYFQHEGKTKKHTEPPPVGYKADPDSMGWRPLFNGRTLAGWKITNFGTQGPVQVDEKDSTLILGMGEGCTGITWQREFPKVNYEIALDAKRFRGNDFFCGLTFPVEEEYCTLIVGGWGGTVVGISNIDGKDASENFTRQSMGFEKQKWYHIRVSVTSKWLRAWIDNQQVAEMQVKKYQFSVRPEVRLSRPLGICSWMTAAVLKDIQFRKTDS